MLRRRSLEPLRITIRKERAPPKLLYQPAPGGQAASPPAPVWAGQSGAVYTQKEGQAARASAHKEQSSRSDAEGRGLADQRYNQPPCARALPPPPPATPNPPRDSRPGRAARNGKVKARVNGGTQRAACCGRRDAKHREQQQRKKKK